MLKKMQRRFVVMASAVFGLVMLVLVTGINITNYYQTAAVQDQLIQSLIDFEESSDIDKEPFTLIADMPGSGGEEASFTTRFFSVRCSSDGEVQVISREHVASVDDETAASYAREILSRRKIRGYYENYRYLVEQKDTQIIILFLNVTNAQEAMKRLLWMSILTGAVSYAVVVLLIRIFSARAIRPYAQNIERQKRFITDAGHELKTPITSITTSADIAAMEYENDEWITNIQKQSSRLGHLVNDLVALSRLDEEIPFPEKTVFSLSDCAWEIAEHFQTRAKASGRQYSQQIEEGLMVRGDRDSLQQLISILLDNAVKYSTEGGRIHLSLERRHGKVCLEVFNDCQLQEYKDLNRLFERFYRPDSSRSKQTGGSGIGLSMAQAIVQAHGGKIKASSKNGREITFRVTGLSLAGSRASAQAKP